MADNLCAAKALALSPNLHQKYERLTSRQQAAVSAYRDALNSRADWIEAVCAALDAADIRNR